MKEVLSNLVDIGLGASALYLARQLHAVVQVIKTQLTDHEKRITILERAA